MSRAPKLPARITEPVARDVEADIRASLDAIRQTGERTAPRTELIVFPVADVHKRARVVGGLPLVIEGIAEMIPGVRFDRPETIPRPVAAIMRALEKQSPFSLVIEVDGEAWRIELR